MAGATTNDRPMSSRPVARAGKNLKGGPRALQIFRLCSASHWVQKAAAVGENAPIMTNGIGKAKGSHPIPVRDRTRGA